MQVFSLRNVATQINVLVCSKNVVCSCVLGMVGRRGKEGGRQRKREREREI